jgi:LPS sulfotransferase NodH
MASTTRFVVYAAMRTGSRWLIELLDSHPDVAAYGEAFLADGEGEMGTSGDASFPYFRSYAAGLPRWWRHLQRLQRMRYLEALYRSADLDATGYKLIYGQAARNPGVLRYTAFRRVRVVHLVRRNHLRAIVSHRVALARRAFHPREGDVVSETLIALDTESLLDDLAARASAVEGARWRLEHGGCTTLEVAYEDLLADEQGRLADVLAYLRVRQPPEPLSTRLSRAVPSLGDAVSNLGEVARTLEGTAYSWMLEEDRAEGGAS